MAETYTRAAWQFRKMGRGEMNEDPVQGEFFVPEGSNGIVREANQNSLDAGVGGGKAVRVRYTFSHKPLEATIAAKHLVGLAEHLSTLAEPVHIDGPMDYLIVEDFNTRGLRGDPRQEDDDNATATRNDFYYFWRNVGRSNKSDTDRGRWGLGKTVFPAASRINSFWGLTLREDDRRLLLMGQSVLKVHKLDGIRYSPYGYFGLADGEFCLPIETKGYLEEFAADFGLQTRTEPGLSVVIPFYRKEELTPQVILKSAIEHFFYPILAGELVIELVHEGQLTSVERTTIREIAATQIEWGDDVDGRERMTKLFDLAEWAIGLNAEDHVTLNEPPSVPRWDKNLIGPDDCISLRERLERGDRIAISIPLKVAKKSRPAVLTHFRVYLEADKSLSKGEDHYIRQGITIAPMLILKEKPFRGLVVATDKALSALLGDSENPAHTEWQPKAAKVRERYAHGMYSVSFVRNSLRQLVLLLSRPPEGQDRNLLRNVFFLKVASDDPDDGDKRGRGKKKGGKPVVLPPPKPQPFKVTPTADGFRVKGNPQTSAAGRYVDVQLGYEIRTGNPFRKYDRCDFDVADKPIAIVATGATVESKSLNKLSVMVQSPDFEVDVTGFDTRRDLRVRAVLRKEESE